jgi:hypothetical protein
MRFYTILVMIFLYLFFNQYAEAQVLEKKISLKPGRITIGQALKKIKQVYGIKFSYANNIIPESREVYINLQNATLKELLDKLFSGTSITYQLVGDQVVLKRDRVKAKSTTSTKPILPDSSVKVINNQKESTVKEDAAAVFVSNDNLIIPDTTEKITIEYSSIMNEDPKSRKELRRIYRLEKKKLRKLYAYKRDSLANTDPAATSDTHKKFKETIELLKREVNQLKDSLSKLPMKVRSVLNKDTSGFTPDDRNKKDSSQYKNVPVQVTFVSPIGTNGSECGNAINKASFNIIGGYAAGLDGIEFGSIANVEKDYVHGLQFSGFTNLVGREVHGGEFAGFLNVCGKDVRGVQYAGFANICGDSVTGTQGAGFCNVNNGSFKGLQTAGFCNVNKGACKGLQAAGFCNINSDSLHGMQVAGFANVSNGNVKGLQAAGFINVAKKVKGVQLGFINIADSIKGIPIGFLSIVRRGYRRTEIYGSESMYGNIAFKTGVRQFYNILYLGGQLENNYYRWAFGYGIGSEFKLAKRVAVNADLISMHVNENEGFTDQLNLLNQMRLTLGIGLSKKTYLFLGPSFNVMVSQFLNYSDNVLGSKIAKGTLYDKTTGSIPTNVKMWIGVNGGLRF